MDTAGDGVFARFDSPAVIRCACAIVDGVRELGVEVRAGIHLGEAEVLDRKLSGVNVHAAARTMSSAGAGEVFVTSSVRAARGSQGVLLIGVDADQHFATPQYVDLWLTSVEKIYRRTVYLAMGQVVHDRFEGGVLRGTLANGGVGLAPFYGLSTRVPASLRGELREIKRGIVDGSISVDPATYVRR